MSVYILKWLQESTPKSVDILHVADPQHALTLRSKGERLGHYHLLCCCTCCILFFFDVLLPLLFDVLNVLLVTDVTEVGIARYIIWRL